jgi:hypothetical protein
VVKGMREGYPASNIKHSMREGSSSNRLRVRREGRNGQFAGEKGRRREVEPPIRQDAKEGTTKTWRGSMGWSTKDTKDTKKKRDVVCSLGRGVE